LVGHEPRKRRNTEMAKGKQGLVQTTRSKLGDSDKLHSINWPSGGY